MDQGVKHPTDDCTSHPGGVREGTGQRAQESNCLERGQRAIADVNAALGLNHLGGKHAHFPEREHLRAAYGVLFPGLDGVREDLGYEIRNVSAVEGVDTGPASPEYGE